MAFLIGCGPAHAGGVFHCDSRLGHAAIFGHRECRAQHFGVRGACPHHVAACGAPPVSVAGCSCSPSSPSSGCRMRSAVSRFPSSARVVAVYTIACELSRVEAAIAVALAVLGLVFSEAPSRTGEPCVLHARDQHRARRGWQRWADMHIARTAPTWRRWEQRAEEAERARRAGSGSSGRRGACAHSPGGARHHGAFPFCGQRPGRSS